MSRPRARARRRGLGTGPRSTRRAHQRAWNPRLPRPILGLLHLEPGESPPADVERGFVLRHQALVSSALHFRPRLQATPCEPSSGQEEALTLHEALQHLAAGMERLRAEILTSDLEHIEDHVDGRRGERFAGPMPEPLESGDEVLIEHRHLAVEDQRGLRREAIALASSPNLRA